MRLDIERLKKLNSLAGELKHQGIAHNHEDAALLAVTMIGEEGEQCLSNMHINEDQSLVIQEIMKDKPIKTQMQKSEVLASSEQQTSVQQSALLVSSLSKAEIKTEMETVMQNFANALVQEFTALQHIIHEQNAQLSQVMEELHALQLQKQQPSTMVVQEQVPVQRTLQQPTQPVQNTPAASASGNPRTGTFATEDVSIEKMFYFGSKKS